MFSMLTSVGAVEGASVLDLFAGSGALGIEALSRGAARAIFVDRDRAAVATIRTNVEVLGQAAADATVVCADVLQYLGAAPVVDLVLADPPYGFDSWAQLLESLRDRTRWLVAETGRQATQQEWTPGPDWETVKVGRYGGTVVTVAQPVARSKPLVRQEGET
jgi:16S rRNA (guanine966-N2)-methyltransferase